MSAVWMCAPSKRPPAEAQPILDLWRARGYKLAIWRDTGDPEVSCDLLMRGEYPGHYDCMNRIVREAFKDQDCDWVVCASDDTEPDTGHTPRTIAEQCGWHFNGFNVSDWRATFGVMQPTGDRFAGGLEFPACAR